MRRGVVTQREVALPECFFVSVVREHRASAELQDKGKQAATRAVNVRARTLDDSRLGLHARDAEIANVIDLQLGFELVTVQRIERDLREAR
jgi:hypothetical protein